MLGAFGEGADKRILVKILNKEMRSGTQQWDLA